MTSTSLRSDAGLTRVALVFGGRSSEHTISCATAAGVLSAIDRTRFEVVPIGITEEGAFTLQPDDADLFRLRPESMPAVPDNGSRVRWPDSAQTRELSVVEADGSVSSLGEIDVVFPILHGPFGEDGTIQGFFELVGLPYVGNGVLASALAMDKHVAKQVLSAAGIPVAPGVSITEAGWEADRDAVVAAVAELGLPVFVKPSRAGSSVGVSKVSTARDLEAALVEAWRHDERALVEQSIVGREVECAVLSSHAGAPRVSVAGEIIVTGREFYDFEAKYLDPDAAALVCPAELTETELTQMQAIAAQAFAAIGGSGLARVDFFLTDTGFVVNEINTMPGFTPISMFPRCWAESGVTYPELITQLIELGISARR